MDLQVVTSFFMWCTVINVSMLFVSGMMCVFAGDWVFRMQSKWFPISRESFNVVIYSFLGLFKVLILVFNVVPYIALVIIS